jgi:spore germination cell wall hydrolase CwlJ-like protein
MDTRLISDDLWGIITVWQEARGEPYAGMVGVAEVILHRTKNKLCSDGTVASTVLWPKQFSGWNSSDPNRIKSAKLCYDALKIQECMNAWQEAKQGSSLAKGATHYYNPKLCNPAWTKGMKEVARLGNHIFLRGK